MAESPVSESRTRMRYFRTFSAVGTVLVELCMLSTSYSWSQAELRYYDDTRISINTEGKSKDGSNVIQVSPTDHQSHVHDSYRLCHLTGFLPTSDGKGNLDVHYGINAEGAILLALLHFNNKISDIVPDLSEEDSLKNCDVRLTLEFRDTGYSPLVANRILIEDLLSRDHGLHTPIPCALVGAYRSAVSGPLSLMARVSGNNLPIISAYSTSSHLDNRSVYGLFGRTVPNDDANAVAAATYLRDVLNVTHCGVLFVRDEYGTAFYSAFVRAAHNMEPPMKVASASFDGMNDKESIRNAMEKLKETGYNYFFCLIVPPTFDNVITQAHETGIAGPGRFWLFVDGGTDLTNEGFKYNANSQSGLARAVSGIGILAMDVEKNVKFDNLWKTLTTDLSLREYFISKQPNHIDATNFSFHKSPTEWEYMHYDAVIALGVAMCKTEKYFFNGSDLFEHFTKTSFKGASGFVSFDRRTGTRDLTSLSYKVINMLARVPNEFGEVKFDFVTVARQVVTKENNSDGSDDSSRLKWVVTNSTTYSDGTHVPPAVLPPVKNENLHLVAKWAIAFGIFLAVVIVAMSLGCAAWTVKHRESPVVKYSKRRFLFLLCVGTLVMASAVFPMSLQEPTSKHVLDIACMATPWLFQIGFVVSFSALFSKSSLMNKLGRSYRGTRRMKVKSIFTPFIVFFIGSVIVLTSWTVVAPLTWYRTPIASFDYLGRSVESYGHCHSSGYLPFIAIICFLDIVVLLLAVTENYRARKIQDEYKESYYIAISMASILQTFATGLPVLVVVNGNPTALFLIRSSLITIISAAVLVPLFVPKERMRKMRMAWKHEQEAKQKQQLEKIGDSRRREHLATEIWEGVKQQSYQSARSSSHVSRGGSSFRTVQRQIVNQSCIYLVRSSSGVGNASSEESEVDIPFVPGLENLAL